MWGVYFRAWMSAKESAIRTSSDLLMLLLADSTAILQPHAAVFKDKVEDRMSEQKAQNLQVRVQSLIFRFWGNEKLPLAVLLHGRTSRDH